MLLSDAFKCAARAAVEMGEGVRGQGSTWAS